MAFDLYPSCIVPCQSWPCLRASVYCSFQLRCGNLTENAFLGVLELEVLIGELLAVDGFATGSVAVGEVTTLDHELLDDTVEGGALISEALLARGQST
jgi:hypothetical protein